MFLLVTGHSYIPFTLVGEKLRSIGLKADPNEIPNWLDQICLEPDPSRQLPDQKHLSALRLPEQLLAQINNSNFHADRRHIFLLQVWMSNVNNSNFLLIADTPEEHLATAITNGIEPQSALSEWKRSTRTLLDFHRRNRSRCVLLQKSSALATTDVSQPLLKMGFDVCSPEADSRLETNTDPVALTLSKILISSDAQVFELVREIEATAQPSSIHIEKNVWQKAAYAAANSYINFRAAHFDLTENHRAKAADNDHLRTQLESMQEAKQSLVATIRLNEAQLEQRTEEIALLSQEKELLLIQLAQVQDDFNEKRKLIEQLQGDMDALNKATIRSQDNERALLIELDKSRQAHTHDRELLAQQSSRHAAQAADRLLFIQQIEQLQAELTRLNSDNQKLHSQVKQADSAKEALHLKCDHLQKEAELVRQRLSAATHKNTDIEKQLSNLQAIKAQHDSVKEQLATFKKQLNTLKQDQKASEDNRANLEAQTYNLSTEKDLLKEQLSQLQDELLHQAQNNATLNSDSLDNASSNITLTRIDRIKTSKRQAMRAARLIKSSNYFDEQWYITTYPDVGTSGIDAAYHFIAHGANEGRDPSPAFSTAFYINAYPDVANSRMNPLIHFIKHGQQEGRKPKA